VSSVASPPSSPSRRVSLAHRRRHVYRCRRVLPSAAFADGGRAARVAQFAHASTALMLVTRFVMFSRMIMRQRRLLFRRAAKYTLHQVSTVCADFHISAS